MIGSHGPYNEVGGVLCTQGGIPPPRVRRGILPPQIRVFGGSLPIAALSKKMRRVGRSWWVIPPVISNSHPDLVAIYPSIYLSGGDTEAGQGTKHVRSPGLYWTPSPRDVPDPSPPPPFLVI